MRPLDGFAELQLLDQQAGHDRLAGAGVVGQQEAQAGLRQHFEVDGFDLVRQRADARQAHGKMPVVGVGQADAGGFDQQPELLGVSRPEYLWLAWLSFQQSGDIIARENGFVEMATRKPDT